MLRSIDYCFRNKNIVSFYCNTEDKCEVLVGYIKKYNDDEILIAHISSHGYYDGFILKHIADIYRIEYDGKYEKKIETLYKRRQATHPEISTFDPNDDEILFSLLDFAKNEEHIASIGFADDDVVKGFINGYNDDVVYIEAIDEFGAENGISIININDIITLAIDTDDEQDLKVLHSIQ